MKIYHRFNQYILITLAFAAPSLAFASDGQVAFRGKIDDSACTVTVNDSAYSIVELGNLGSASFNGTGDASSKVGFTIAFSDCGFTSLQHVKIVFAGTHDSNNNDLLAIPVSDSNAKGYAIGIYDQDGNLLPLGTYSPEGYILAGDATSPNLQFYANYVTTLAKSGRVSGDANATATFNVSYR